MKYAVEMGSAAVIHISSFIKIGSGIQKLIGGIHRHKQHGDRISLQSRECLKVWKTKASSVMKINPMVTVTSEK
jgi:hypothetical protein